MCPGDGELVRLLAGETTAQQRRALAEHLEQCPGCRDRYARLEQTWRLLGEWTPPAGRDLAVSIVAAARRRDAVRWWTAMAAAVVLAAGAGVVAGLITAQPVSSDRPISTAEVVQAIGLDHLAAEGTVLHETLAFNGDGELEQHP